MKLTIDVDLEKLYEIQESLGDYINDVKCEYLMLLNSYNSQDEYLKSFIKNDFEDIFIKLRDLLSEISKKKFDFNYYIEKIKRILKILSSNKKENSYYNKNLLSNNNIIFSPNNYKGRNLINEIPKSKITPSHVLAISKKDDKIYWIEKGCDWSEAGRKSSGFIHILLEHKEGFIKKGIAIDKIPYAVLNAVVNGNIVGRQGDGRMIYETIYKGKKIHIAVTVSEDGYIVGANINTGFAKKNIGKC